MIRPAHIFVLIFKKLKALDFVILFRNNKNYSFKYHVFAEIEARGLGDKGFQEEMGARLLEK